MVNLNLIKQEAVLKTLKFEHTYVVCNTAGVFFIQESGNFSAVSICFTYLSI